MNYKGADGKARCRRRGNANTKFAMMDYQKVKGLAVDGASASKQACARELLTADIVGPPPQTRAQSRQFG